VRYSLPVQSAGTVCTDPFCFWLDSERVLSSYRYRIQDYFTGFYSQDYLLFFVAGVAG
jgi:hypothetical protein